MKNRNLDHDDAKTGDSEFADVGLNADMHSSADPTEKPIADQIAEIAADAKALAETEIAYYRAKLNANISRTKRVLAYFGLGLALCTAGLTALVLGLLMTLAPLVGPGPATAIIAGGFIFIGGMMILWSVRKAKRIPLDGNE